MGVRLFVLLVAQALAYAQLDMGKISDNAINSLESPISSITQPPTKRSSQPVGDQASFFEAIAGEIWKEANNTSSTITPQNLNQLAPSSQTLNISPITYSNLNTKTNQIIDHKLANYLVWAIALQSAIILIFSLLYISLQRKITHTAAQLQIRINQITHLKSTDSITQQKEQDQKIRNINNLRKALL